MQQNITPCQFLAQPSHMGCHVLSMDWICSLAFILRAAMLKQCWSTSSRGNLSVNIGEHWYCGGAMGCILWFMTWGWFKKPWLWYPVCRPCAVPMMSGIECIGVVLVRGDANQGSIGSVLLMVLMLVFKVGRLKQSMGESWSFTAPVSIFSWRLHLARRFWNHTWINTWTLDLHSSPPPARQVFSWCLQDVSLYLNTSVLFCFMHLMAFLYTYLYSDLREVDFHSKLLTAIHIRIVRLLKGTLELMQLICGEGGAVSPMLLLWLLLICLLWRFLVILSCFPYLSLLRLKRVRKCFRYYRVHHNKHIQHEKNFINREI